MSAASRVVLVTGVSSGIGREVVRELLRRGHRVSGIARRKERLDALSAEAGFDRERLHLVAADVNEPAATGAWIDATAARWGGLDAVVHNAGYGVMGPFDALSVEDFRAQLETNFFAVVRLTRELLPHLERRGGGDVILVSSILGRLGLPGRAPYCASKWALEGFAASVRPELRSRRIRVSVVNPGFTETEFASAIDVRGVPPPRGVHRAMPARRVAEEIADCLRRERRNVLLTALGRMALWTQAVSPGLLEWVTARSFRRELKAAAAARSSRS